MRRERTVRGGRYENDKRVGAHERKAECAIFSSVEFGNVHSTPIQKSSSGLFLNLVAVGSGYKFQIFVFLKLIRRNKGIARNHRIKYGHSSPIG